MMIVPLPPRNPNHAWFGQSDAGCLQDFLHSDLVSPDAQITGPSNAYFPRGSPRLFHPFVYTVHDQACLFRTQRDVHLPVDLTDWIAPDTVVDGMTTVQFDDTEIGRLLVLTPKSHTKQPYQQEFQRA